MKKHFGKIIFLVILASIVATALSYLSLSVDGAVKSIEKLSIQLNNSKILPQREVLEGRTVSARNNIEIINSYLIDSSSPVSFIESIEQLAQSMSLSFSVKQVNTGDIIKVASGDDSRREDRVGGEIVLEFEATGSLDSVRNFVKAVENMDKEVYITASRLSRIENEESESSGWTIILTIRGISN